jgi:ABC-type transport system involved in cytochrome c biogenesis permease component
MTAPAILLAELKRGLKNHLAYPVQAACEIITVIFTTVAVPSLLEGSFPRGISGVAVESPEKVVALAAAFVALIGLQIVHRVVREESDLGALEQLCLTPIGLPSLIVFRCTADTIRIMPVVLIVAGMVSPSQQVGPILLMVSVIVLFMNMGMLGIGFFLGSLTLIVKRLGFIPNLASLALLPLALSPSGELPQAVEVLGSVLPFAHGVRLMEPALKGFPVTLWISSLVKLCILSGLWLILGIRCFVMAERFAKDRGLLGKH